MGYEIIAHRPRARSHAAARPDEYAARCDGCGAVLAGHPSFRAAASAAADAGWTLDTVDDALRLYDPRCAAQDPRPQWRHYDGDPSVLATPATGADPAREGDTPEDDADEKPTDLPLEAPAAHATAAPRKRKHKRGGS